MSHVLSAQRLRVVANPYHALDAQGRPAGAVPLDPTRASGSVRYIGATLAATVLERWGGKDRLGRPTFDPRGYGRQDTTWSFSDEPVEIEDTPYHRQRLASRELFAADEATHATVFRGRVPFVPPADALAVAKADAAAAFERETGAPPPFAAAPAPPPASAPALAASASRSTTTEPLSAAASTADGVAT